MFIKYAIFLILVGHTLFLPWLRTIIQFLWLFLSHILELIKHFLRIFLKVPRCWFVVMFFLVDLEPIFVEIIQKGKIILYLLIGDKVIVRGNSPCKFILNWIKELFLQWFGLTLFNLFLSSQSCTGHIFALSLLDDLLIELLLEDLLEMPEAAVHVEVIRRVFLRFIVPDIRSPVEFSTATRFESLLKRALRWLYLLIAPFLLRKRITIHGQCFLELVELLSLDPTLHILHILPQLDLQLRHL